MEDYLTHCCQPRTSSSEQLPVKIILSWGLDTPLTPTERDLQGRLAKRSLPQSPQSLLQVQTGGQVRCKNDTSKYSITSSHGETLTHSTALHRQ